MSLYIVEDDCGNVLDSYGEFDNSMIHAILYDEPLEPERDAEKYGGHVVELFEKPAPIVVSEAEAKILTEAKAATYPVEYITRHSCLKQGSEDRLMRAYVIGLTVEKTKQWNVKVPHAEKTLYRKHDSGALFASIYVGPQNHANDFLFTEAEIEQYGLQDCEKKEVTDDEQ